MVYDAAALALLKDIFYNEANLPASDAVTVELWDGDPDAAGDLLEGKRVGLPWLISTQPDPYDSRGDNPEVIAFGPAGGSGWSVTHLRILCGPVGAEVPIWKSETAGGTLAVPAGYYSNVPAAVVWSLMTWTPGDSGTGAVAHVKPSAIVLAHALGNINEIRSTAGFVVEIWAHDPLHIAHGSPLTSIAVNRNAAAWTLTTGPPAEMENAAALTSADEAPVGGWAWDFTTLRVDGGTAFLLKSSTPSTGTIAEGDPVVIAAGALVFSLTAA